MSKHCMSARLVTSVTLIVLVAGSLPAFAGGANSCDDFSGPNCGDAQGDAFCLDQTGAPDPLQDCAVDDVTGSCTCRPRVCCDCDSTNPTGISACALPCTETGIGLLVCVAACALVSTPQDTCQLSIVNNATCTGDSCPTTGCCTFNENSQARTVSDDVCVATDAATCNLLNPITTFVPGGTCVGGLFGTCVAPTATATATATATSTLTATATITRTVTNTPTNTPVPDGGDCVTPAQCASMFCVDGVCCDTACDQPFETCNDPENPGECTTVSAPVPAMSGSGLLIGFVVLALVGALALMYRVRSQE